MENKTLPPGRFFKPYSVYADRDGETLACYYTKIRRDKNSREEYPLSVALGRKSLSIYWHGHQKRVDASDHRTVEDYGVHRIFSFEFSPLHKEAFVQWLGGKDLIPRELEKSGIYTAEKKESKRPATYSDVFFVSPLKTKPPKQNTPETGALKEFFLDLLFDLQHSNLFTHHPHHDSLMGFLKSIPSAKGIMLKAEYLLHHRYLQLAKVEAQPNGQKIKFAEQKLEEACKKWLDFLRTKEGEASATPYWGWFEEEERKGRKNTDGIGILESAQQGWFEGVEKEHDNIFKNSDAGYLRKEAEDSVQWLLERYNLWRTYGLQIKRIFSPPSKVLFGAVMLFLTLLLFPWLVSTMQSNPVHCSFWVMFVPSLLVAMSLCALVAERAIYLVFAFIRSIWNLFFEKTHKWLFYPSRDFFEAMLSLPKIINTIKPKILLASGAVWTFLFAANFDFLWGLDYRFSSLKIIVLIFLVVGSLLFMMAKLNTMITHHDKSKRFWALIRRGVLVFLLASTYSFIIGLLGMSFTAEKRLTKENALSAYFQQFDSISPGWMQNTPYNSYLSVEGFDSLEIITKPIKTTVDTALSEKKESDSIRIAAPARKGNIELEYFNKVLPHLYRDTASKQKVCFSRLMFSMKPEKPPPLPLRLFAVVEPLIFFTFVAVAVGILLEMGLRLEGSGISFD